MSKHAVLSPSGAHRWLRCAGSVEAQIGMADTTSKYAEEGTAAHSLAALMLAGAHRIESFIGTPMDNGVVVTPDMARDVSYYTDYIDELHASTNGSLFVEVPLPLEKITGEAGAVGTADIVIVAGDELIIVDLKFGMGDIVSAADNEQMGIYAAAALLEFSYLGPFSTVRMIIHQPRVSGASESVVDMEYMRVFTENVKRQASIILGEHGGALPRAPGVKQCKWCKAQASCQAAADEVTKTIGMDFQDMRATPVLAADIDLGKKALAVEYIEMWCKAVMGTLHKDLLRGVKMADWKLVKGREGNRAWLDPALAEETLKRMRLKMDQMYEFKLVSPTKVDTLIKDGAIGKKQAAEVTKLIHRPPGKLVTAVTSDKRPAVEVESEDNMFNNEGNTDES